ncbi:hypothetical protein CT676_19390 [Bradyrhizobium sp. MOS001]|nr:hypothetical protein CT676_19390 [Bradyrhizobium sp. MOS001]
MLSLRDAKRAALAVMPRLEPVPAARSRTQALGILDRPVEPGDDSGGCGGRSCQVRPPSQSPSPGRRRTGLALNPRVRSTDPE